MDSQLHTRRLASTSMAAAPLPPAMLYHFNVIYNHAKSPLGHTPDTQVSHELTTCIVQSLEAVGLVNSYYHDRDKQSNLTLAEEMNRVLSQSQMTILILTPGFINNCFYQYTHMNAFRRMLDETPGRLIVLQSGLDYCDRLPAALWSHTIITCPREDGHDRFFWWQLFDRVRPLISTEHEDAPKREYHVEYADGEWVAKQKKSKETRDVELKTQHISYWKDTTGIDNDVYAEVKSDTSDNNFEGWHDLERKISSSDPLLSKSRLGLQNYIYSNELNTSNMNELFLPDGHLEVPFFTPYVQTQLHDGMSKTNTENSDVIFNYRRSPSLDDSMVTQTTVSIDSQKSEAPFIIESVSSDGAHYDYDSSCDEESEDGADHPQMCFESFWLLRDLDEAIDPTKHIVDLSTRTSCKTSSSNTPSTRVKYQEIYERLLYMDDDDDDNDSKDDLEKEDDVVEDSEARSTSAFPKDESQETLAHRGSYNQWQLAHDVNANHLQLHEEEERNANDANNFVNVLGLNPSLMASSDFDSVALFKEELDALDPGYGWQRINVSSTESTQKDCFGFDAGNKLGSSDYDLLSKETCQGHSYLSTLNNEDGYKATGYSIKCLNFPQDNYHDIANDFDQRVDTNLAFYDLNSEVSDSDVLSLRKTCDNFTMDKRTTPINDMQLSEMASCITTDSDCDSHISLKNRSNTSSFSNVSFMTNCRCISGENTPPEDNAFHIPFDDSDVLVSNKSQHRLTKIGKSQAVSLCECDKFRESDIVENCDDIDGKGKPNINSALHRDGNIPMGNTGDCSGQLPEVDNIDRDLSCNYESFRDEDERKGFSGIHSDVKAKVNESDHRLCCLNSTHSQDKEENGSHMSAQIRPDSNAEYSNIDQTLCENDVVQIRSESSSDYNTEDLLSRYFNQKNGHRRMYPKEVSDDGQERNILFSQVTETSDAKDLKQNQRLSKLDIQWNDGEKYLDCHQSETQVLGRVDDDTCRSISCPTSNVLVDLPTVVHSDDKSVDDELLYVENFKDMVTNENQLFPLDSNTKSIKETRFDLHHDSSEIQDGSSMRNSPTDLVQSCLQDKDCISIPSNQRTFTSVSKEILSQEGTKDYNSYLSQNSNDSYYYEHVDSQQRNNKRDESESHQDAGYTRNESTDSTVTVLTPEKRNKEYSNCSQAQLNDVASKPKPNSLLVDRFPILENRLNSLIQGINIVAEDIVSEIDRLADVDNSSMGHLADTGNNDDGKLKIVNTDIPAYHLLRSVSDVDNQKMDGIFARERLVETNGKQTSTAIFNGNKGMNEMEDEEQEVSAFQGRGERVEENRDEQNTSTLHGRGEVVEKERDEQEVSAFQGRGERVEKDRDEQKTSTLHGRGEQEMSALPCRGEGVEKERDEQEMSAFHGRGEGVEKDRDEPEVTETCKRQEVTETCDRQEVTETCDRQEVTETCDRQEVTETLDRREVTETLDRQEVTGTSDRQEVTEACKRQEVTETCDRQEVTETYDRQEVTEMCDRQEVTETCDRQEVTEMCDRQEVTATQHRHEVTITEAGHEVTEIIEHVCESYHYVKPEVTSIDENEKLFESDEKKEIENEATEFDELEMKMTPMNEFSSVGLNVIAKDVDTLEGTMRQKIESHDMIEEITSKDDMHEVISTGNKQELVSRGQTTPDVERHAIPDVISRDFHTDQLFLASQKGQSCYSDFTMDNGNENAHDENTNVVAENLVELIEIDNQNEMHGMTDQQEGNSIQLIIKGECSATECLRPSLSVLGKNVNCTQRELRENLPESYVKMVTNYTSQSSPLDDILSGIDVEVEDKEQRRQSCGYEINSNPLETEDCLDVDVDQTDSIVVKSPPDADETDSIVVKSPPDADQTDSIVVKSPPDADQTDSITVNSPPSYHCETMNDVGAHHLPFGYDTTSVEGSEPRHIMTNNTTCNSPSSFSKSEFGSSARSIEAKSHSTSGSTQVAVDDSNPNELIGSSGLVHDQTSPMDSMFPAPQNDVILSKTDLVKSLEGRFGQDGRLLEIERTIFSACDRNSSLTHNHNKLEDISMNDTPLDQSACNSNLFNVERKSHHLLEYMRGNHLDSSEILGNVDSYQRQDGEDKSGANIPTDSGRPKELTQAQMTRKRRRGTNVDGLPSSSSSSSSSGEEEQSGDWMQSLCNGLAHGVTQPEMPYMG